MVRDLEHLDGRCPGIERPALSTVLRVAEEQGAASALLHEQHHARVVGVQAALPSRRPQHADPRRPHGPGHVPAQTDDGARAPGAVDSEPVDRLVHDVGHADPVRAGDTGEAGQPARVIVVRVSEHEPVEGAHAGPRQRPAQHHGVRTRVHEQGS